MMEIETISEKEKEELFEAVEEGDIKLVRKIISNVKERNIDINSIRSESDGTLLHYAAGESNLEMLKFLIAEGCDVNASDKYGWTVLHSMASSIAEREGSWQIMKWFLQQHKNLDIYAKTITDFEVKDVFAKVDYSLVEHYEKLLRDSAISVSK
jgi:ankyrin repeat protein